MNHNDILLIYGPEWTVYDAAATVDYVNQMGVEAARDLFQRGSWGEIDGIVEAAGLLPTGMTVSGGKFLDTTNEGPDRYIILLQFMPLVPSA
jgi:hypothetical protein